jgi:hypothetical protein
MKTFLLKLVLWLPLAFLLLALADMFFLHKYFFVTRYSVLQTPALAGLTISYIIATISEAMAQSPIKGIRNIYKWNVAIPLAIFMILFTLASMSR